VTRAIVVELIDKKFGIRLGLTAVGELLAKLGLTPQKPLQRAYQRDPEAIEKWQRETFPAVATQAKAVGAESFSGMSPDSVPTQCMQDVGRSWTHTRRAATRTTPIHQRGFAVNAKGAFWFSTYEGGLNAELFIELLKKMMKYRKKPFISCSIVCLRIRRRCEEVRRIHRGSFDAALPAGLRA